MVVTHGCLCGCRAMVALEERYVKRGDPPTIPTLSARSHAAFKQALESHMRVAALARVCLGCRVVSSCWARPLGARARCLDRLWIAATFIGGAVLLNLRVAPPRQGSSHQSVRVNFMTSVHDTMAVR